MTFEELGLGPTLLSAIKDAGYETPTPIQEQAIPVALTGRDVLGIAQTGTGKTASFTLPLIERLSRGRARARMPRSLIICPTRELAAQVAENFETYAKNHKLTMALLIGGVAFGPQDKILDQGADVLIATPGRLLDQFERGKLLLTGVQIMVVDEADRMLDMGFIPDIERIFKLVPPRRQTLFFSATMADEITRLVNTFLNDPVRIEVTRQAQTADNINQLFVRIRDKTPAAKRDALRKAIEREGVKNGIVFCNRKRDVDTVARSLQRHGFSAAPIHGDLEQSQRTQTLADFKSDKVRLLVASDVAARGLDIPAVSHVFNFDVPRSADDYVHRIGRTGRAGMSGEAITIVTPEDSKAIDAVTKLIGFVPEELKLGAGSAQTEKKPSEPAKKAAEEQDAQTAAKQESGAKEAEAAPPREPRKRTSGRRRKSETQSRPARRDEGTSSETNPRPARSARRDETEPVDAAVGFGDHVPEFLLRPAIR
ncbi:DEAD/DEAH box helicase [Marinicauda sp. Alg238-R41]|uniref:DEAD/DEAH box helicase n=1 Tax=Marinicauda sp. Alg238-R41 TaxID=2993447 RepID=UPI0022E57AA0|nr:DEAD/DEAH box helicase [Marinicauda sp. Alg238-R41]